MKKLLFLLAFSLYAYNADAQYTDTVRQYLLNNVDANGQITGYRVVNPDSSDFTYYRIAKKTEQGAWHVQIFYADSKSLQSEGMYLDDSMTVKDGKFYEYYDNGKLASEHTYYQNNPVGLSRAYYKNGVLADSSRYKSTGMPFHKSFYWDEEGHLVQYGDYDMKGTGAGYLTSYYEDSSVSEYGKFAAGHIKDSVWTYYHKNRKVSFTGNYDSGKLADCSCYDMNGEQITMSKCDSGQVAPRPTYNPYEYLAKNCKMPDEAKDKGLWGRHVVMVKFTINTDGKICCPEIAKGSGYKCFDDESLRVIGLLPAWKPAKYRNRPIREYYVLPVSFILE
ncbi:MAG: energy transducer TonB [Chitinophagales bacterium]|nr:energy transducer TonB [Chitinophagales bacterium]